MSSYKKFSLNTFRAKVKGGDYDTLAGANRAIGKMHELSEDERSKAKALAATHFGSSVPKKATKKVVAKPAAKPTKKVVAKPAKKVVAKPAKKPAAKPAKKVVAKPVSAKPAKKVVAKPAASPAKKVVAKPVTKPVVKPAKPAPRAPASEGIEERRARIVGQMGTVISTVGQALSSMEATKKLFPKADLEAGVTAASDAMSRAVRVIDIEVLQPRLGDTAPKAKPATKQAAKPAAKPAAKTAAVPGKRVRTVAAPVATPAPANGEVDESELDPESAAALDDAIARSARNLRLKKAPSSRST
jgi:hypothetical protein